MTDTNRVQWSSRLTFIMAAVGCAVGLGNIWLFPFLAGVNGGGAFVLVYLLAVVILALPVLIAELMVGRRGAAGPPRAIAAVARESGRSEAWSWMGVLLGGLGALFALSFYAVAGGWAMAYTFKMAAGQLQGIDAPQATLTFDALNGSPGSLARAACRHREGREAHDARAVRDACRNCHLRRLRRRFQSRR
jgi:NSS family neurotransmitter:Na+ symporter